MSKSEARQRRSEEEEDQSPEVEDGEDLGLCESQDDDAAKLGQSYARQHLEKELEVTGSNLALKIW